MLQPLSSRRAGPDAKARPWAQPRTAVASRTLDLLGFRLDRLFARGPVALASVVRAQGGFAALETPAGVRQIARDFLPPCVAGDVLRLTRHGAQVRFEVDAAASKKAADRLRRLLDAVLPPAGPRLLGA